MPDYSQGKIYKIVNTVNEKIYIGSTVTALYRRMKDHRQQAKTRTSKFYSAMRRHGVENFKIELIKDYPCETLKQLEDKEFRVLSKYIAGQDTV